MPSADSANKWRRQRMNVKRAKTAGFCFGVKRAVETVYEQAKIRMQHQSTLTDRSFTMKKS